MARSRSLILFGMLGLAGCADAQATPADPNNDVHCSVVAFYFRGHPATQAAPADQRHALEMVHQWYSAKARDAAAQQGEAAVRGQAGPVLEAVKSDFLGHRDALAACTNRAVADPSFDSWLRTRGGRAQRG